MLSVPTLKELSAKHADQGLVLIGIHSSRGGEKMPAFVEKQGIQYPVAWDKDGAMAKAFGVDGYPDYQVIDRSGKVRVADLANSAVESVIQTLLAEPAPSGSDSAVPEPLQGAAKVAVKKDKRILCAVGDAKTLGAVEAVMGRDRDLRQFLSYEYELVKLDAGTHPDLARAGGAEAGGSLIAFGADGTQLGQRPLQGLDGAGLSAFLKKHQVPTKDAAELYRSALAEATRDKKRVLVHLGAPW